MDVHKPIHRETRARLDATSLDEVRFTRCVLNFHDAPTGYCVVQSSHDSRLIGNGDVEGERRFGESFQLHHRRQDGLLGLGTGKVAENPQAKVQSRDLLTGETQRLLQGYRIEDMDAVVVPELNIDKLVRPISGNAAHDQLPQIFGELFV